MVESGSVPMQSKSTSLKIDLHNHTIASPDSVITEKDLVNAYQAGKFDVIAITDHNTIKKAQEIKQKNLFPVIVGEEIDTRDGDIIGLFLNETIPSHLSAQETIQRIKKQGGLVYIPHPFDAPLRFGLRKETIISLLPQIDLLETHNGSYFEWLLGIKRKDLVEFAHHHQIIAGAGSDSHVPSELGISYLTLHNQNLKILKNPQVFLKACQKAIPTIVPYSSSKILLFRILSPRYMIRFFQHEDWQFLKRIWEDFKMRISSRF